jgi:2-dehydro-3-deoxy-D-gluconate 5-dehydrogenase
VEIERLLGELEADRRQIDILVNNAAIIRRAPAAQHSDAEWDEVLAVNLTAPFILSRGLGRHMLSRGYGKIIFVASVLSFQGGISVPSYTASKAALANGKGAGERMGGTRRERQCRRAGLCGDEQHSGPAGRQGP